VTGKTLNLVAPLPDHMARTFSELGWEARDVPADPFAEDAWD
jgi:23S rRNA pseudouridine955/2504/2580 synthase